MRRLSPGFLAPLLVAGGYLYLTEQIPVMMFGDPLGPRAFPRVIAALLALAGGLWLLEALLTRPLVAEAQSEAEAEPGPAWLPGAVVAWFALYVATLEWLGFVAGSALFLLGLFAVFHRGHAMMNVAVAIGLPLGAYLLFTRVLAVSLPAGILFPA